MIQTFWRVPHDRVTQGVVHIQKYVPYNRRTHTHLCAVPGRPRSDVDNELVRAGVGGGASGLGLGLAAARDQFLTTCGVKRRRGARSPKGQHAHAHCCLPIVKHVCRPQPTLDNNGPKRCLRHKTQQANQNTRTLCLGVSSPLPNNSPETPASQALTKHSNATVPIARRRHNWIIRWAAHYRQCRPGQGQRGRRNTVGQCGWHVCRNLWIVDFDVERERGGNRCTRG